MRTKKRNRYSPTPYRGYGIGAGFGFGGFRTTYGDLQTEMVGTTGVFGRDADVVISFNGEKVENNGGNITFPSLDPNMLIDSTLQRKMRGFVDSESAITRYSDRSQYETAIKKIGKDVNLEDLFRSIEGARVEFGYTDDYSGSGKNLAELGEAVLDVVLGNKESGFSMGELSEEDRKKNTNNSATLAAAICNVARSKMQGVWNYSVMSKIRKSFNINEVEDIVSKIRTLNSTKEAFEFAKSVYKNIGGEEPNEDESGSGNGKDGEKEGVSSSFSNAAASALQEEIIETVKSDENCYINPDGKKAPPYRVLTTAGDRTVHWSEVVEGEELKGYRGKWRRNINRYLSHKGKVDAQLGVAKKRLELMIQAKRAITWDGGREVGRLNSKQLVSAFNGNPFVFKKKIDNSDLDTAVALSIDLSGSMSGSRSTLALRSAIILSELLDRISVPFEVTGFCTMDDYNLRGDSSIAYRKARASASTKNQYSRIEPLLHQQFKRFQDRMFDARPYFHDIETMSLSSTQNVDGESILTAAQSISKRQEKRKIMFVLSDGQPAGAGSNSGKEAHLKYATKRIAQGGIDIIGIGIESDAVRNYYDKHIVLEDASNLPQAMLDLLREHLL